MPAAKFLMKYRSHRFLRVITKLLYTKIWFAQNFGKNNILTKTIFLKDMADERNLVIT